MPLSKSATLISFTSENSDRLSYYRLMNNLQDLGHCNSQRLANQFGNACPALYVKEFVKPIFYSAKGPTNTLTADGKEILGPLVYSPVIESELLIDNFLYDKFIFSVSKRIGIIAIGNNKQLLSSLLKDLRMNANVQMYYDVYTQKKMLYIGNVQKLYFAWFGYGSLSRYITDDYNDNFVCQQTSDSILDKLEIEYNFGFKFFS